MLLPERMSKVLVVGAKDRLKDTIELLYELENVHVVDFPADTEGFTLGSPLHEASDASQDLLKLRSMEKDLNIDPKAVTGTIPVNELVPRIQSSLPRLEEEISGVASQRAAKAGRLSEIDARLREVQPYRGFPLDIELYHGYKNITALSGSTADSPLADLAASLRNYETFEGEEGHIVVFVDNCELEEAKRVLSAHGFTEIPLPSGTGSPLEESKRLAGQKLDLEKELAAEDARLAQLRDEHAQFVLASDEHLSIIVEKAETPLRFGATARAFTFEAWVPTKDLKSFQETVESRLCGLVHVELLEEEPAHEHGEACAHEEGAAAAVETRKDVPPTRMLHGKLTGLFSFFIRMMSTPKYNEVDPTIVLAIFFPIFFGMMVGDVGYGVPFVILGALGLKKVKSQEWKAISTMLFFGGIFATVFGLFVYGDMFGMEFYSKHGDLDWSTLLGVELPHLGFWNKINDIKSILWICVWIGIFHMLLGSALGFYNIARQHGLKHAVFEKLSWMMIMIGAALLLLKIAPAMVYPDENAMSFSDPIMIAGIALVVAGILMAVKAEGATAIIETPEVLSNILSYTRIAAIGLSKAGMALAFNYIALEFLAPGGGIMLVFALLVFIIGHLMIFILAIMSAGLHSIRLQYVELFTKFYEGGGEDFKPLKINRKYTTTVEE